jgi:hypothetical protein
MTDGKTGTGNDAPVVVNPTPSAPKPSSPNVGPTYDRALVYDEDGKLWKDKFLGREGHVQQVRKQLEEAQKEHGDALKELQAELEKRQGTIETLNSKLVSAGEQLGELQGLKDRIPELEEDARKAAKLEAIMEYPELISLQVKDVVEVDGEEHELLVNPIIDLVQNTNLEGDELRMRIRRLSQVIQAKQPAEPVSTVVTDGAAPAPGEPVEESPEYWEQKAREAHTASIMEPGKVEEHTAAMIEYSEKAREARTQLQS